MAAIIRCDHHNAHRVRFLLAYKRVQTLGYSPICSWRPCKRNLADAAFALCRRDPAAFVLRAYNMRQLVTRGRERARRRAYAMDHTPNQSRQTRAARDSVRIRRFLYESAKCECRRNVRHAL